MDGHGYSGIREYSDKGWGGEGWTSLDYPWMVVVTLASADTLTGGGKGGHSWIIHGWSYLVWAYVVSCPDPTLSRGKGSGDH